ncbi:hypothetical protein, partial [Chromatium okenii]
IHPAFNTADQKRFTLTDQLSRGSDDEKTYSLYLYDVATGGAGYVSQMPSSECRTRQPIAIFLI